jgi:hypothetical protein
MPGQNELVAFQGVDSATAKPDGPPTNDPSVVQLFREDGGPASAEADVEVTCVDTITPCEVQVVVEAPLWSEVESWLR